MPNFTIFKDDYSITDGLLLMVAGTSSISNASQDALFIDEDAETVNTNLRYFYYITVNGLTHLRHGSELFSIEL